MYYKGGDTFESVSDKPVNKWEYDEEFFEEIELSTSDTLSGVLAKSGKLIIKATDTENQSAEKVVIVKERVKQ